MVTLEEVGNNGHPDELFLYGLYDDKMPTDKIDGYKITDGSELVCTDTGSIFIFDETTKKWIEQ